jgi:hypothetical protein
MGGPGGKNRLHSLPASKRDARQVTVAKGRTAKSGVLVSIATGDGTNNMRMDCTGFCEEFAAFS